MGFRWGCLGELGRSASILIMTEEKFREISEKYIQGTCSQEEKDIIDKWFDNLGKNNSFLIPDEQQLENRLLNSIQKQISETTISSSPKPLFNPWRWVGVAAAASITIAILAFFYPVKWTESVFQLAIDNGAMDSGRLYEVMNTSASSQKVFLPDGSTITLQKGSSIKYDSTFDGTQREIYLDGEAFFDVYRDINRPFLVYTHNIVTKVLGTSFTITAYDRDENITVKVKTGKVLVYTIEKNQSGNKTSVENTLTPNQQIIYNRSESIAAQSLVEQPEVILPIEEVQRMRFEEAPVTEILEALEKIYGMEIEFDEATFATCTLTTSISDGGIFNRLDIICNAIGATYTVEGTQIKLNGSGCE